MLEVNRQLRIDDVACLDHWLRHFAACRRSKLVIDDHLRHVLQNYPLTLPTDDFFSLYGFEGSAITKLPEPGLRRGDVEAVETPVSDRATVVTYAIHSPKPQFVLCRIPKTDEWSHLVTFQPESTVELVSAS